MRPRTVFENETVLQPRTFVENQTVCHGSSYTFRARLDSDPAAGMLKRALFGESF